MEECAAAAAARSLLTIPDMEKKNKNKKTSSSLSSLPKWKEKDERQWNDFIFFFFLLLSLSLVSVERLRIGLSHVYPLCIYTNIKRYRTQTVDLFQLLHFLTLNCLGGFVIFPSDCINIEYFSLFIFVEGILVFLLPFFFLPFSLFQMDGRQHQ